MSDYNYAVFDMARDLPDFEAFKKRLPVGERVKDYPLEDLSTAEQVSLASYYKRGPAIVEFGSFT